MTIRRILCPIDFSEANSHAVEHAVALARRHGARVTAFHVHALVSRVVGLPSQDDVAVQGPTPAELRALEERAATTLRPATEAGVGLDVIVTPGHPVEAILAHAASLPADLIVMGTHGATGFHHLVLGSVAEKVLRKAACPVLTVPPRAHTQSDQPFARLLCAVDFSECSLKAVDAGRSLARESGATLTLLHVVDWPWHESTAPTVEGVPPAQARALADYHRYLETSALARLQDVASGARADGITALVETRFGKPYRELLDVARDTDADLIVMGVQGRDPLDLGFFGSTTNHVVRSAECPVLTVRT